MKKRVGILTSGGDCPGLNATIRGAAKALYQRFGDEVEIVRQACLISFHLTWRCGCRASVLLTFRIFRGREAPRIPHALCAGTYPLAVRPVQHIRVEKDI